MQAVILAGGNSLKLYPLTNHIPKAMLKVANKPLLEYILLFLRNNGINDVIIAISEEEKVKFTAYFGNGEKWSVNINYCSEADPLGTAGALTLARKLLTENSFIVIKGGILVDSRLDLMVLQHKRNKNIATVTFAKDVDNIYRLGGLYIFSQKVFEFIPEKGNFDIKEQLLPILKKKSQKIEAVYLKGYWNKIFKVTDYMRANYDVLLNKEKFREKMQFAASEFPANGAVVIGENCNIDKSIKLLGPVAIGSGCFIEKEVVIKNSMLFSNCIIGEKTYIENSIVTDNKIIPSGTIIKNGVVIENIGNNIGRLNVAYHNFEGSDFQILFDKGGRVINKKNKIRLHLFKISKRILDVVIALTALILTLPVFIIIAVVIKLDSAGPVFFIQKRMMNKDKEFKMIKFRSMVQDADKKQIDFEKLNLTDGPMFKIINDPRFTRVGRLISALSLDELPQLINVLLGQISIVGPRPLSDNELRYNPYWREVRLMVKQGVTGMWQAEGRKMEFESWIRNDLFYVKNQSLSLDFKIIFNTARMLSTCIARQVKLRSKAVPIDVQAQKIKARPQFGSLKGSKSIYGKDC